MPGTLDVFYFPGSTYTYLSALRAAALAEQSGLSLRWRPFNVRAIIVEMDNIPLGGRAVDV